MNDQPTNQAILEAINDFADSTEQRFQKLEQNLLGMGQELTGVKSGVASLKTDIIAVKATMVTKDYLDTKLADLRGDLVVLTRKEDTKVKSLINLLKKKKVISVAEEKQLLTMEPFAELML